MECSRTSKDPCVGIRNFNRVEKKRQTRRYICKYLFEKSFIRGCDNVLFSNNVLIMVSDKLKILLWTKEIVMTYSFLYLFYKHVERKGGDYYFTSNIAVLTYEVWDFIDKSTEPLEDVP